MKVLGQPDGCRGLAHGRGPHNDYDGWLIQFGPYSSVAPASSPSPSPSPSSFSSSLVSSSAASVPSCSFTPKPMVPLVRSYFSSISVSLSPTNPLVPY